MKNMLTEYIKENVFHWVSKILFMSCGLIFRKIKKIVKINIIVIATKLKSIFVFINSLDANLVM
jgi:hypothetical protein